jgi:hypothetical protein
LEADPCGVEVATPEPAPFASAAPHLPQKLDVGRFSALHFAQCFASALPHFAQKLFVEGLFVPHFEQRIDAPREPGNRPLLYHPTLTWEEWRRVAETLKSNTAKPIKTSST